MSHARLLAPVIDLVRSAGAATLPYWRTELAVREKADASPVTAADMAAHAVLGASWERWWLVDPLDGTKEFISGSAEFTVNVALIERGQVRFGVVGVPASGRCYYGGAGLGAWRLDETGAAQPIRVRLAPQQAFTVVASRRHSSPAQERLLRGLGERFGDLHLASVGSSLKFCLLAEGQADCYPRLAPTSQWDTAAAQGVLEGAGGAVLDLRGAALRYDARDSYLNPSFLALPGAAGWREALLELARGLD